MKFCKKCVIPTTRPNVTIEAKDVCNACESHSDKDLNIDWDKRRQDLVDILEMSRSKDGSTYDCLVPVSGGKDSTWQIHTLIHEFKMRPLAYTWKPRFRTEIGERNLQNLIEMGVDHIDFTCNPDVERRFMLKAFEKNGSPSLTEHMAMYALAMRIAINYGIKAVIWGEHAGAEYGGSKHDRVNAYMNRDWIKKFGVSNGTFAEDWMDDDFSKQDMLPYAFPEDDVLEQHKIRPIFLGWHLRWDPLEVAKKSRSLGFEWNPKPFVGYYQYADLDAPFVHIHHMFKWYKFGFTRTFDNLSIEIRNGRMTRDEAVQYLRDNPDPIPQKQIHLLCEFLKIPESKFWDIVEKHRNPELWKRNSRGEWHIPALEEEFGFFPRNYEHIV